MSKLILIFLQIIFQLIKSNTSLKILQIVPGFTNSHVLFNYRLADTLKGMGHQVTLWTQMEMNMVFVGDLTLPANVTEFRVPIVFKDKLKLEGLKVFQEMIFKKGTPYDLWWTGQEFKDMRLESCEQMLNLDPDMERKFKEENFDLAIGHFHDFCPVGLAKRVGVDRMVWVTHGTSTYDFNNVQIGLRTFPAFVPHPLSASGDRMDFLARLFNLFWHFSTIEFVNLPNNLLHEENELYREFNRKFIPMGAKDDLWALSHKINVLLVNGERFLDFPRPLPLGIIFMGEIGSIPAAVKKPTSQAAPTKLPPPLDEIYTRAKRGVVIFSLGTVSNTTNMPTQMAHAFVHAFARFPELEFIWKTEREDVAKGAGEMPANVHLLRWIPQKALMKDPRTKLLIAHGGYNSFLEAAKAGIPCVLMPLFADQFINAERARRFGIAETLDKLALSLEFVENAIGKVLEDKSYAENARKLSSMLRDKPSDDPQMSLKYALKLAMRPRDHFALKSAQSLHFIHFYMLDLIFITMAFVGIIGTK